ncbi:hypothetical protein X975_06587, partial [Stegodyphus mimosarum]
MMSFLLPYILPRKSISNIPLPEEATTDDINVSLENNGNDSVYDDGFEIGSQVSVNQECSTSDTQISPFYGESSISTPQGNITFYNDNSPIHFFCNLDMSLPHLKNNIASSEN